MKKTEKKSFYITTPVFYPNDKLHLGHAYTMVIADSISRYKRDKGYDVYFQTGSDDHGEKVQKKSRSLGMEPIEMVDKNVELFKKLWKLLGISKHNFYRTSSKIHKTKVQRVFKNFINKGDIYLGQYEGNYCITCEDYVTLSNLAEKKDICPFCNTKLNPIKEKAYFLNVSKYFAWLRSYYHEDEGLIIPGSIKKEMKESFMKDEKVRDLCISRKDITWGIPVPGENNMTIYVWFEALLNYVNSQRGLREFSVGNKNSEVVQIIGKDISRFHCLYWPIILKIADFKLPNKIISHGWILNKGSKMSKSKGNVLDPVELINSFGKDTIRAYFISKISFLNDGFLDENLLKGFHKEFFINNLGNLVSRTSKMVTIYFKGSIPNCNGEFQNDLEVAEKLEEFAKEMDGYRLTSAFKLIEDLINLTNKFISEQKPWKIFKEEGKTRKLENIINRSVIRVIVISKLLSFFIPETGKKIMRSFKLERMNLSEMKEIIFDCNKIEGNVIRKMRKQLFNML